MIKVTNQLPTLSEANRAARMESAVHLPQYVFFDLSGAGVSCFGPAPDMEHIDLPFDTPAMALEALHLTRLSRDDLATRRLDQMATASAASCDHARICDPDTVSDAGTSGVQGAVDESDDDVDSFDELFFDDNFARKIDALAELLGLKGPYEPAAVLGEVVRVLQEMNRKTGRSAFATRAV